MQPTVSNPITVSPSGEVQAGSFKNQWLNFALYLPNFIFMRKRRASDTSFCRWLIPGIERLQPNAEPLGGGEVSTQYLANGNEYQTAFVEINKTDLLTMLRAFPSKTGYQSDQLPALLGLYRQDPTAPSQGATLDVPGRRYFYRGRGASDVLRYLVDWNVLN